MLDDGAYFYRNPVYYSLVVEANILKFRHHKNKKKLLFGDNFFDNYKALVRDIKEDVRNSSSKSSFIKSISNDSDTKNRIARELMAALKAKDKNMFLNILLKNLNENKPLCANNNLNSWIFKKIIKNNISFEIYGLLLTANLVGGKKND